MKTLMLLRHGKSSWKNASLSDHERPLNERGRNDAPRMGRLLYSQELVPDLIYSSTATRAADTAAAAALAMNFEGDIVYTDRLYHAAPETVVAIARATDESISSILMVGHNPGLEELMEDLSGHAERLPTAALAVFELEIDTWDEFGQGQSARLAHFWLPRAIA
ncbi:MAG: histidine phosphatase family protein [Chloroflexota bacterium]